MIDASLSPARSDLTEVPFIVERGFQELSCSGVQPLLDRGKHGPGGEEDIELPASNYFFTEIVRLEKNLKAYTRDKVPSKMATR